MSTGKKCPNCGFENSEDRQICKACKYSFAMGTVLPNASTTSSSKVSYANMPSKIWPDPSYDGTKWEYMTAEFGFKKRYGVTLFVVDDEFFDTTLSIAEFCQNAGARGWSLVTSFESTRSVAKANLTIGEALAVMKDGVSNLDIFQVTVLIFKRIK